MQNFTTTLQYDLVQKQRIYLPAGQAEFTLIDVEDVGSVTARILAEPHHHIDKTYELTNNETLTFEEMASKLSDGLDRKIEYVSPNLLLFFWKKLKEGTSINFILVMIMLHYLPRFQKTPKTTAWVKNITGREAKSFNEFVRKNYQDLR